MKLKKNQFNKRIEKITITIKKKGSNLKKKRTTCN